MVDRKEPGAFSSTSGGLPLRPPSRATREAIDDEVPDLTDEQRQTLKNMLETRRAELRASIDAKQAEERDIGRDIGDEMDDANIEGITAMASRLLERDVRLLAEIDRALAKFESGTYGICEGTGEPISYGRLRSRPWARFGVEYQEQLEREARARGGI